MPNPFTPLLNQLVARAKPTTPPVNSADKNPGYAYGVVPGDSPGQNRDVLGQMWQVDHALLYAVYLHHPDVFAAVNKWMGGVTANGWHIEPVEEEADNTALQPQIDNLTDRFRHANPYQSFTELLKETVMHLGISGDAYWYKLKTGDQSFTELWALHPAMIRIMASVHGEVLGYVMRSNASVEPVLFEPEEVIHFRLPNPTHDLYGLSPLTVALEEVRADMHMLQENMAYFVNGMTPQSVMLLDDTIKPEAAERLIAKMRQTHQGSANSHKMAAIAGAKDVKVISGNLKDAEFISGRALQTAKIAAAFEVPEVLLGYHNARDYASSDMIERMFYQTKILPLQRQIAEAITEGIVDLENPDLQFAFDALDFTDQDTKRKDYLQAELQGILTADEVRAEIFDLPPLEADEQPEAPESTPTDSPDLADEQEDVHPDEQPATQPDKQPKSQAAKKTVHKAMSQADLDKLAAQRFQELEDLTNQLVPALGQYFAGQQQGYLDSLSKELNGAKLAGFVAGSATADTELHMLLFGLLVASLNAGAQTAQLQINMTLSFDQLHPMVQDYLQNQALAHAKGINQTTRDALKATLADGLRNGEGVDALAKRIESVFTDAKGYRSMLIARTETAQAYEYANQQSMKLSGVVSLKQWLTAEDERVCNQCGPLDGATAPLDDSFDGGVEPGTIHVQCRCTSVGIVEGPLFP